ncbi:phage tail protein [Marinomonas aquiplantarum]|uniref:Tail-collar fiber protein n=1 Tax=Marinomonas aquiplantarum TaxID=491951 RepID=A0A366D764_9GAMM|nr:phage tail protein [Marinomonas aquiplantarum]RBO85901.1 tail-collar fiber protein [Marinomonas aquiplantarum]
MSFLTQAGEAQIANKQGNGLHLNVRHFVLANVPNLGAEPSDRDAVLPSEESIVDIRSVTKRGYVNPNQVVYSLIMDSTIGDFTFNWIGLVDEEGVLIAVAHITPIDKRKSAEGVEGNTIARNFLLKYSGIQNVTGTNVPAQTWQLDFSTRFNGMDERERLSNLDLYGQASFLDGAYQVIKENNQYQLQAGVGYVGGIRTQLTEEETLSVSDLPCSVWLDVSLQGDMSDKATVSQIQVQMEAEALSDYVDSNGIAHYVSKLASIDANGGIIDHRVIYDNVAKHEAKANPHPQYQLKRGFAVSGTDNAIVLTSLDSRNPVTALSQYDEFTFEVAHTNSGAVTIQIDGLAPLPLRGVTTGKQVFVSALLTVRFFNDGFYIAKQVNPLTGNDVLDITKLWIDTVDVLRPGEYALDGSTLSRTSHPIAFAIAQASSNFIAQATKDADPVTYGGYYGDGDGSTTFTLPIVGGEFIRMHDGGRGVDAGRGFASWQGDEFRSHHHSFPSSVTSDYGSAVQGPDNLKDGTAYSKTNNTGGNETRPRNLAYYGKTRL